MTPRGHRFDPVVALLAALATLALVHAPALAQGSSDAPTVRIRQTDLQPDGMTRLLVSVTGPAVDGTVLEPSAFAVRDGHVAVDELDVAPLLESEPAGVGVILVIDVSGSTAGEPLQAARSAARDFADEVTTSGASVGLVSFGPAAQVVAPLGSDVGVVHRAVDGLVAEGETSLYDAISLASRAFGDFEGLRNIVVFSDGADTVSTATLDEAVAAATSAEASVTTVALATEALDPDAIGAIADGTAGQVIDASDSDALAGAFEIAAAAIASQYVITYTVVPTSSADLDLAVSVTVDGVTGQDVATVVNPRQVRSSGPAAATIAGPLLPAEPWLLWVGLGAVFLALVTMIGVVSVAARSEGENRRLERSLRAYTTGGTTRGHRRNVDAATLSRRAGNLVDRLPRPAGFDAALQRRIDQTSWPLRSSEFVAIQIGATAGIGLLAWALTGSLVFLLVGGALGWFVPRAVLDHRVRTRASAFMEQLPDTLQLMAGSLKAGYGLVQAIDTVVRESPAPTSEEFSRVLTETRLGMGLSDALEGMAERTDSEDFGWVVMAINIQSQVGGNLAQLLETVAGTLREREQVRRQVKTLSAEGKLSAWVLIGLVPAMGLYMLASNPEYVSQLWTTSMGRTMSAIGLVGVAGGILGIKKVITIEV